MFSWDLLLGMCDYTWMWTCWSIYNTKTQPSNNYLLIADLFSSALITHSSLKIFGSYEIYMFFFFENLMKFTCDWKESWYECVLPKKKKKDMIVGLGIDLNVGLSHHSFICKWHNGGSDSEGGVKVLVLCKIHNWYFWVILFVCFNFFFFFLIGYGMG